MRGVIRYALAAVAGLCMVGRTTAKEVVYNFNVSWVTANPDGLMERKVVGINNQWPLPVIEVDKGDRLIVHMYNGLEDHNASIHFHGMFQNGTNEMDGPSMVTQCPVLPGQSFTYNFTVNQNGTYWYHCHTDYCYPDGYRQAFLVHDKDAYFHDDYDKELTLTISDWYHDMMEYIAPRFLTLTNPTGAEPVPNAFLLNDTVNSSIAVEPNTTYLLRLINIGAFVAQYFYIEGHTFKIVEIDGVYTEPTEAEILYISPAQRYSVLITTKGTTDQNYPIVTVADSTLLDVISPDLQLNMTNWLEYNPSAAHPIAEMPVSTSSDLLAFDDFSLIPHDRMELLPSPNLTINLTVTMDNLINGAGYAFLNDITYTMPKVPTIFTVLSSPGNISTNPAIYGTYTHPVVLNHNDIIEIVLNNEDTGSHPFHLHGHSFQVINREPAFGPHFYDYADGDPFPYDPSNHPDFPPIPVRRDTVVVPPQGHFVIRFVADNPGVWFFHCHIDWHLSQGLGMLLIEAPQQMQERLEIPQQHYDVCKAAGVPVEGNAAGNTVDFLNLEGQNVQPAWLPEGFTARGIVALVFSIGSALVGMWSIGWYGLSDPKGKAPSVPAAEGTREDEDVTN